MKKLAFLLLCLFLLCGCKAPVTLTAPTEPTVAHTEVAAIPTETTVPTEETTVPTEPEPTLPPHSVYYNPDISAEDVITWFNEVNIGAEFVNGGDASLIQKWEQPICYYIFGEPTGEDLIALNDFVQWVNTIPGFPGMSNTSDLGAANMKIYFCEEQQLYNIMGPGFDDPNGMDGAVTYWYDDNNRIYNATVCIRTDLTQTLRNSVIKEELYNGLGPINDTVTREDSLIFSGYSEPQTTTPIDELIIALLYDPAVCCGMNALQCAEAIRTIYY